MGFRLGWWGKNVGLTTGKSGPRFYWRGRPGRDGCLVWIVLIVLYLLAASVAA